MHPCAAPISLVAFALILGVTQAAFSASVGLPAGSSENRLEFTAQVTHVFDRDLSAPPDEKAKINSSDQAHGRLGWTLFPWLQLYGKGGIARFEEDLTGFNIGGVGRRNIHFEYEFGPSWGGGACGLHSFGEGWFVGYDLQWIHAENDLDRVVQDSQQGTLIGGQISVDEWHGAGYLGQEVEMGDSKMALYVGGRYSFFERNIDRDLNYTTANDGTILLTGKSRSEDRAGLFLGARWTHPSRWSVGVEGRFFDESAVSAQASYTF